MRNVFSTEGTVVHALNRSRPDALITPNGQGATMSSKELGAKDSDDIVPRLVFLSRFRSSRH